MRRLDRIRDFEQNWKFLRHVDRGIDWAGRRKERCSGLHAQRGEGCGGRYCDLRSGGEGRQGPRGLRGRPRHCTGLITMYGEDIQDASMSLVLSSCTIGQAAGQTGQT